MEQYLTPRQQRFIEEYIKEGNATKAAKNAGYAEGCADVQGSRLLRKDRIRAIIQRRTEELQAQSSITRELIEQNTLKEAKTATRASDRLRAWEILAKMGGYLKEQTQQVVGLFTRIDEPKSLVVTNDTPST